MSADLGSRTMFAVRVAAFFFGVALASWTLLSAIRTVILPRNAQSVLARGVFTFLRRLFDLVAPARRSYEFRDAVMALYSPIGLVSLAAAWLALVTAGFTLMFWAVDGGSVGEAFHISGSSITTLGFAPADTLAQRTIAFIEAGIGLFLVALMITYLPSLYQAFSRREAKVALLEVRAGRPPSAVEFLVRHHTIGWLAQLDDYWLEWEAWFAEVEETHTSYPALVFFRSPDPGRSWVTAAGTVLDAASLMASSVEAGSTGPMGVCIRSGFIALRRIASSFGIAFDPDPDPGDPISISREEFERAYDELAVAGLPVRPDREQAWRDFSGWRVNYDTVLLSLADVTMAPFAVWTSDRSSPSHRQPKMRRFGRRS